MSMCKQCFSGLRHEGEAEGKIEKIADLECYIATPSGPYAEGKAVLFLTDAFGMRFINNQLLADNYALNGFKVLMPDLFDGEPYPPSGLDPGSRYDSAAWLARHRPARGTAIVRALRAALASEGVSRVGCVAFCYGARAAVDLALEGAADVIALAHPSLLEAPADFEKYLVEAKAPLLINSCEFDPMFPAAAAEAADAVLGGGKFAPGYTRVHWEGVSHSFAIRGDLNDPKVKAAKEGAFKAMVEFLGKHL